MQFPIDLAPEKVRVDCGKARKTAVATEELLSDAVTAAHYKVGARDALGSPIKLGEPMTYVDWKGPDVFKVYQWDGERWQIDSEHPTAEAAIQRGGELLQEMAAAAD